MLSALFNNSQEQIDKWWQSPNVELDHMKPSEVFDIDQDKVVNMVHAQIRRMN